MQSVYPDKTQLDQIGQQFISGHEGLRAIIDNIPNPIWTIDLEGRLTLFNKFLASSIYQFFQIELKPGHAATGFLPESFRSNWDQIFSIVLEGEKWSAEYVFEAGNQKFYSEISGNPIIDAQGKTVGATFMGQDITYRKNAEEALRYSEEKFRQLAENITDSFILVDTNRIIYLNPAFEIIYGRKREELISNPEIYKEWIHPDDRTRISEKIGSQAFYESKTFNEQFRIVKPDGAVRWIWNRNFPIRNREGAIYRSVSVASDITVQKELETKLLLTRAQHKALLDNIPHMAWLKDSNGRYISVNESFAKYYKLSIEDIIGKSDFEVFSEERARDFTVRDQEVITTGKQQRIEKHAVRDSKSVWTETFKTPIFNEQGQILGITGISIDITEQKSLQEELRVNEERFRGLLQFSSDALTMLDKEGTIIFESSLEGKISGFTISELMGTSVFKLVHPDDLDNFRKAFIEATENPCRTTKVEFRGVRKGGSFAYIESIFANHLENEQIRGIVMNSRDVTRRKIAEFKEKKNRDNQAFLSSTALDFLSFPTETNLFPYIGRQLCKISGSTVVIVSSFNESSSCLELVFYSGSHPKMQEALDVVGTSPIGLALPLTPQNYSILTNNSTSLYTIHGGLFEASFGFIPEEKCKQAEDILGMKMAYGMSLMRLGKLLGSIVLLTSDPTFEEEKQTIETFIFQASVALHRRTLELELIKARDKAEESDRIKTTFLANMSHEIRTPMNGILGFAQLLTQPGIDQEELNEYVDAINNNGRLLINLINDIIDISRIESGQVKLACEPTDINKTLDEVWRLLITSTLRAEKPDVQFILKKGLSAEPFFIETDPFRLRQILNNLLGNAIKFTHEGSITLGYRLTEDSMVEFFVKDTGIGIASGKQDAIFERFVQADTSTTRQYGGSGLGLAISRGFVEILGGDMSLTSAPGEGSQFAFTLPFTREHKEEKKIVSQIIKPVSSNKSAVLIVDDDRFSSKYLDTLLQRKGIETKIAFTAREAFSIVENEDSICLVLMDIQLPVINGLEATRQIKKMRPELPVIAQTANAYEEDRQRCMEAGCDGFIPKPINVSLLMELLDKFLVKK
jgi:PAS domain S-box-containing protein